MSNELPAPEWVLYLAAVTGALLGGGASFAYVLRLQREEHKSSEDYPGAGTVVACIFGGAVAGVVLWPLALAALGVLFLYAIVRLLLFGQKEKARRRRVAEADAERKRQEEARTAEEEARRKRAEEEEKAQAAARQEREAEEAAREQAAETIQDQITALESERDRQIAVVRASGLLASLTDAECEHVAAEFQILIDNLKGDPS